MSNASQRPTAGEILKLAFIKRKIQSKIRENEAQLKTVNIMASDCAPLPGAGKAAPKKPANAVQVAKLPKLVSRKDLPLPLPPDEEPPKWAQRSGSSHKEVKTVVATEVERGEQPSEYRDLQLATERLQKSLTSENLVDPVSIREKIADLRRVIEKKIGKQLLAMLADYIQREDDPNCAQFVDIMTEQDQDVVEQIRDLISLENTFSS
jgi:hypothetical protein